MASDGHKQSRPHRAIRGAWSAGLLALPLAVAALLSSPGFRFPFLFDDFELLARAQAPGWGKFLPDPHTLFYRPISREGYFGLLLALGGGEAAPHTGHILNFALLALAIVLLYSVVTRLSGRPTGLIAAFLFASFGQVPMLVAWVSGCQDLLAIDFLLAALLLQLLGRRGPAVCAAALALLSKETSIALFPVLATAQWILGSSRRPSGPSATAYLGVSVLWLAIHPGVRLLAAGGFTRTEAGYLGLDNPDRLLFLVRGAATLLNLPSPGVAPAWTSSLALPALLSLTIVVGGLGLLSRVDAAPAEDRPPRGRVVTLGVALALLPLIPTSLIVRHWAPYYVVVSAIGGCIALSALFRAMSRAAAAATLSTFLALGVVMRGALIDPTIPTEANLAPAARALEKVQAQMRGLVPAFPDSARVLVSVLSRSEGSVRVHLYRYQVPRWWYRNRSLEVTRPEMRDGAARPEYLFWIAKDLTVYEVDLKTLLPRSLGPRADYLDYQKVMRAYARGLADSGDLGTGVWILLRMPEIRPEYRNLDHRIAGMLLLEQGYAAEATRALADLPPISRKDALDVLPALMETPARQELRLDAAMPAFGLSLYDVEAVRSILGSFRSHHAYPQMRAAAQWLLVLRPMDREAKTALEEAARGQPSDLLIAPTP